ncbi:hypothetical protein IL306_011406 [Fusarium sp. DS 682]|nr:hypothetical protein IL306_011406 [Fusarium sp. DS 682]
MSSPMRSYRDRFEELRIGDEKRRDLIKELIDELENSNAKREQAELDLQTEQDARRRLQQELLALQNRARTIFQDRFIKAASAGGEGAADELLTATREYLRTILDDSERLDVVVKAFARLDGLGSKLAREGRVRDMAQLRAFCAGFSSRLPLFDFIDVGSGKERADNKIRGTKHTDPQYPMKKDY